MTALTGTGNWELGVTLVSYRYKPRLQKDSAQTSKPVTGPPSVGDKVVRVGRWYNKRLEKDYG